VYPGLVGAVNYQVPDAAAALRVLLGYTERATWGETLTMNWELNRRSQWAIEPFNEPPRAQRRRRSS
jgi:hypothetical protein